MTATQNTSNEQPKTASDTGDPPLRDGQPLHGRDRAGVPLPRQRRGRGRRSSGPTPPSRSGAAVRSRSAPPSSRRAAELMDERRDDLAAPDHPRDGQAPRGGRRRAEAVLHDPQVLRGEGARLPGAHADRADGGQGRGRGRDRAGRRAAGHRAVELPLLPGGPRRRARTWCWATPSSSSTRRTCPQCALAIEQLFADAGAPEGVFTNVFLKISDVETGRRPPVRRRASP